jgi:hypothetical protein
MTDSSSSSSAASLYSQIGYMQTESEESAEEEAEQEDDDRDLFLSGSSSTSSAAASVASSAGSSSLETPRPLTEAEAGPPSDHSCRSSSSSSEGWRYPISKDHQRYIVSLMNYMDNAVYPKNQEFSKAQLLAIENPQRTSLQQNATTKQVG